ncbi:MAG: FkbM family methyltransferase [Candidatus Micrarchaeota archaeon]|nr:FkbM family methyltransferase [Candidatus Micrarchaeota archaeon]MDE1864271.1 FkbM family methyltransferase [Candidatus Micrarchaeota archaeon]
MKNAQSLLYSLFQISGYMKNWYEVVLLYFGIRTKLVAKLVDGGECRINGMEGYYIFRNCRFVPWYMKLHNGIDSKFERGRLKLAVGNRKLVFNYGNQRDLANIFSILYELLVDGEYSELEVKNKQVVDIGASFGDTAIYFAIRGAQHVYAFELYPSSYLIGTKNVAANTLKNRITFLNEGCGPESGSIFIDPKHVSTVFSNVGTTKGLPIVMGYGLGCKSMVFEKAKKIKTGKKIKISTLDEIVRRYGINDGALKIDCEGAEYGIILGANNNTLKRFTQMIIEYHYGYRDLIKKLHAAGFDCTHTMPREMTGGSGERFEIGFISARRRS